MFALNDDYYKKQIITYLGNKRKFVGIIEELIQQLKTKEQRPLTIGEGFSGSGVLSRVFKNNSSKFQVNDIAGYSNTLNKCYLSNPAPKTIKSIKKHIDQANMFVDKEWETNNEIIPFVQQYWAPKSPTIKKDDRVFFTYENGKRIDAYMHYIMMKVPKKLMHFLIAPLLVEISIHNNTNGQFTSFYKDKGGKGKMVGQRRLI